MCGQGVLNGCRTKQVERMLYVWRDFAWIAGRRSCLRLPFVILRVRLCDGEQQVSCHSAGDDCLRHRSHHYWWLQARPRTYAPAGCPCSALEAWYPRLG